MLTIGFSVSISGSNFEKKKSKKSMPFQKISTLDELNPRELNPYDLNKKFIRV